LTPERVVHLPEITPRQFAWGVAAMALAGWLLRASPLAGDLGPWAVHLDYDEGVYFSAASFLAQGVLPYRDFVFVHPPGMLLFLLPVAAGAAKLGVAGAFVAARCLSTAVGAGNILLCGLLGRRAAGTLGGLVAAALYAVYPEAVVAERGVFLEPLLTVLCLGVAVLWAAGEKPRWPWLAGALAGLALATKLWGGLWLLAAVATAPAGARRTALLPFAAAALAAFALVVGPFVAQAPRAVWLDTLWFHWARPPDHLANRLERLSQIFSDRHAGAWLLAWVGALRAVLRWSRIERAERFVFLTYGSTLLVFLAAGAFWAQYDAFLAPSEVVLAAMGARTLWELAGSAGAIAQLGVGVALSAAVGLGAVKTMKVNAGAQGPELPAALRALRQAAPANRCLFALEPGWALGAGRLPSGASGPPWVDPYARMLLDAAASGRRFKDAEAAFADPASQQSVQPELERCGLALLGLRGQWQLSAETREALEARWVRRVEGEPDLWERTAP
jgi:hypothetical protein